MRSIEGIANVARQGDEMEPGWTRTLLHGAIEPDVLSALDDHAAPVVRWHLPVPPAVQLAELAGLAGGEHVAAARGRVRAPALPDLQRQVQRCMGFH